MSEEVLELVLSVVDSVVAASVVVASALELGEAVAVALP